MIECTYCKEPLNEDEIIHYEIAVDEMLLCSDCLIKY